MEKGQFNLSLQVPIKMCMIWGGIVEEMKVKCCIWNKLVTSLAEDWISLALEN